MNIKRIIIFPLMVLIFVTVFSFMGAPVNPVQAVTTGGSNRGGTPAASAGSPKLENPLGDTVDPRIIVGNIVRVMLGLVGSLALAVFVYGGFNWVTSAGNEEKIKKGKDMITWASLGLAVVFLSYVLVRFVIEALTKTAG